MIDLEAYLGIVGALLLIYCGSQQPRLSKRQIAAQEAEYRRQRQEWERQSYEQEQQELDDIKRQYGR